VTLIILLRVDVDCKSHGPAVSIKDDSDSNFPSVAVYVYVFCCSIFFHQLILYYCDSILASTPSNKKILGHKHNMCVENTKCDRGGGGLPSVTNVLWV